MLTRILLTGGAEDGRLLELEHVESCLPQTLLVKQQFLGVPDDAHESASARQAPQRLIEYVLVGPRSWTDPKTGQTFQLLSYRFTCVLDSH